ncbi:hypothetical protein FNF31_04605 [Cafeteria roenbergensis]|uniref:Ubiquitin-like protease family profile domain-containing protein n=1 Tax=Cafeteria roenbergensis TaxID=33653 RepID=A0A5A8D6S6_CAFRO|nr:hypothetical protein FNF31_04605 [Cafeteria roenbergensis]
MGSWADRVGAASAVADGPTPFGDAALPLREMHDVASDEDGDGDEGEESASEEVDARSQSLQRGRMAAAAAAVAQADDSGSDADVDLLSSSDDDDEGEGAGDAGAGGGASGSAGRGAGREPLPPGLDGAESDAEFCKREVGWHPRRPFSPARGVAAGPADRWSREAEAERARVKILGRYGASAAGWSQAELVALAAAWGHGPGSRSDLAAVVSKVADQTVRRESLYRMLPGEWLSDENMNFWVIHLWLLSLNDAMTYNYESVRKWTRKQGVDVRFVDLCLFPVNVTPTHWALVALDLRAQRVEYLDSLSPGDDGPPRPGSRAHRLCSHTLRWLRDECAAWPDVGGIIDTLGFTMHHSARMPQQRNGYDCGVFALWAAESLALRGNITWSQWDVPAKRWQVVRTMARHCPALGEDELGLSEPDSDGGIPGAEGSAAEEGGAREGLEAGAKVTSWTEAAQTEELGHSSAWGAGSAETGRTELGIEEDSEEAAEEHDVEEHDTEGEDVEGEDEDGASAVVEADLGHGIDVGIGAADHASDAGALAAEALEEEDGEAEQEEEEDEAEQEDAVEEQEARLLHGRADGGLEPESEHQQEVSKSPVEAADGPGERADAVVDADDADVNAEGAGASGDWAAAGFGAADPLSYSSSHQRAADAAAVAEADLDPNALPGREGRPASTASAELGGPAIPTFGSALPNPFAAQSNPFAAQSNPFAALPNPFAGTARPPAESTASQAPPPSASRRPPSANPFSLEGASLAAAFGAEAAAQSSRAADAAKDDVGGANSDSEEPVAHQPGGLQAEAGTDAAPAGATPESVGGLQGRGAGDANDSGMPTATQAPAGAGSAAACPRAAAGGAAEAAPEEERSGGALGAFINAAFSGQPVASAGGGNNPLAAAIANGLQSGASVSDMAESLLNQLSPAFVESFGRRLTRGGGGRAGQGDADSTDSADRDDAV